MTAIDFELSEQDKLPRRVWAGMLGLYALIMLALLSAALPGDRPIDHAFLTSVTLVISIALAATLIVILGGRTDVRRVVASCAFTLLLSACAVWMMHWGDRHDASHADTSVLAFPWNWIDHLQRQATRESRFDRALTAQVLGVAVFEEAIKLLPAMIFFAIPRSRRARSFLLSAALGGLIFGVAEGFIYTDLVYQRQGAPAWEYVMRFGASAPAHAFWSAIGVAVTCAMLSARCGRMASIICGWSLACVLHGLHNTLQGTFGPVSQVPSIFAAMLLLFLAVRWAWRVDPCSEVSPARTMVECP